MRSEVSRMRRHRFACGASGLHAAPFKCAANNNVAISTLRETAASNVALDDAAGRILARSRR
jgi:hypothetical protein